MHTPGPWTFVESTDARIPDRITGPNDAPVARGSIGTNRADAVLIAAAPDLLRALQTIADSEPFDGGSFVCDFETLRGVARAAIDKATKEI
jgi:hypothetical protein